MATGNRTLEVSELLQGKTSCEEVWENTDDVGITTLQPRWLEVLHGAGAA